MPAIAAKELTVYGMKVESMQKFCTLLGYKARFSQPYAIKVYGSLENMVKKRFGINSDAAAKEKLANLLRQKEKAELIRVSHITKEDQCAFAYINHLINKGDDEALKILCSSFNTEPENVLASVKRIKDKFLSL